MAGGGGRRDEGSLVINSTNVFAALESLRKKKKSEKESKSKGSSSKKRGKEPEKEVFWAPTPLTVKSWADVDDEDDDDYYATTAPPQSVWGSSVADQPEEKETKTPVEESENEELGLDDVDDDNEEEHDHEAEILVEKEPLVMKPPEVSLATKETERQLSKKELKKKGLEELDAVLAELGYPKTETSGQDGSGGTAEEKKAENGHGELEKKENAPGESKSAKKKKKKDKSSKEAKESQDPVEGTGVENGTDDTAATEKVEDASTIDVKERLKKAVSLKKKKSSKEMDAAARAAAAEAAARNAKLAAAKKKEKNHYNQQPVR